MNKLEKARIDIERIDKQMIELFIERMSCSREVVLYKIENNLPILDASREKALIEKNSNLVPEELRKYYIDFLKGVITVSKDYQKDIMDNE